MRLYKKLIVAVMFMGILAFVAVGIAARAMHPEYTETQLFISYWKLWLLDVALIVAVVIVTRDER